jgi:hypothetical protein
MHDDLVTVHNANWVHDALFVKSVLEGDGIDAFVPDEHTLSVDPALGAALGGVRVQVRSVDADRARRIIAAVLESAADEPIEPGG